MHTLFFRGMNNILDLISHLRYITCLSSGCLMQMGGNLRFSRIIKLSLCLLFLSTIDVAAQSDPTQWEVDCGGVFDLCGFIDEKTRKPKI